MSMYRFNSLTGRLVSGTGQKLGQAIKGATAEAPQIIFESSKVKIAKVTVLTVKPTKPGYGEVPAFLRRKYEHFQKDDGTPIHLKGGPTDVALYYLTLIGCAVGLEECFRYYYHAAFPQRG